MPANLCSMHGMRPAWSRLMRNLSMRDCINVNVLSVNTRHAKESSPAAACAAAAGAAALDELAIVLFLVADNEVEQRACFGADDEYEDEEDLVAAAAELAVRAAPPRDVSAPDEGRAADACAPVCDVASLSLLLSSSDSPSCSLTESAAAERRCRLDECWALLASAPRSSIISLPLPSLTLPASTSFIPSEASSSPPPPSPTPPPSPPPPPPTLQAINSRAAEGRAAAAAAGWVATGASGAALFLDALTLCCPDNHMSNALHEPKYTACCSEQHNGVRMVIVSR